MKPSFPALRKKIPGTYASLILKSAAILWLALVIFLYARHWGYLEYLAFTYTAVALLAAFFFWQKEKYPLNALGRIIFRPAALPFLFLLLCFMNANAFYLAGADSAFPWPASWLYPAASLMVLSAMAAGSIIAFRKNGPKGLAAAQGFFLLGLSGLAFIPGLNSLLIKSDVLYFQLSLWQRLANYLFFLSVFSLLPLLAGESVRHKLKINPDSPLAGWLVSLALGWAVFMLGIFFLSLLGWLNAAAIAGLALLLLGLSWRPARRILLTKRKNGYTIIPNNRNSAGIAAAVLVFYLLSVLFVTVAKPFPKDADSQNVYFTAPYAYVQAGRYLPLDYYPHAGMGQNTEMLYAGVLAFLPPSYLAHLSWLALLLGLLAAYALARSVFPAGRAGLSPVLVLLAPVNAYFAYTAKVDLWLVFYLLVISYLSFSGIKTRNNRHLLAAGALAGIAVGIKYTALAYLAALFMTLAVFGLFSYRFGWKKLTLGLSGALLLGILAFLPWGIKNLYYYQNILHPLELTALNGAGPPLGGEDRGQYNRQRLEEVARLKFNSPLKPGNPAEYLKSIWRQTTGRDIFKVEAHNLGLALLLLPLLFLGAKKRGQKFWLSAVLAYLALWGLAGSGGLWYLYFAAVLVYLLLPAALARLPALAWLYLPFALSVFIANLPLYDTTPYLMRREAEAATVERQVPNYEIAQCYNRLSGPQEKLIIAAEFRAAFIDRPREKVAFVDPYLSITGAGLADGPAAFSDRLKANNIKYILHSRLYNVFAAWPEHHGQSLAEYRAGYSGRINSLYDDIDNFHQFLRDYAALACANDYYFLYRLK